MVLVIVSLVLVCGVILVVGSHDQWGTRRCPTCRYYVPRLATKCRYCHESLSPCVTAGALLLVSLAAAVPVQAFTLTDCHQVHFFQEGCAEEEAAVPQTSPVPPPPPLLFPRETMAPFAAPLLVHLANNRTLENARAYRRWVQARQQAHDEVQRLIAQAIQEEKAAAHAAR